MEEDIKAVSHVGRVPGRLIQLCVGLDETLPAKQDVQTIADTALRLLGRVIGEAVTSLELPEVKQGLGPGGGEHRGLLGQVVITLRPGHLSITLLTAVTPELRLKATGGEYHIVLIRPKERLTWHHHGQIYLV